MVNNHPIFKAFLYQHDVIKFILNCVCYNTSNDSYFLVLKHIVGFKDSDVYVYHPIGVHQIKTQHKQACSVSDFNCFYAKLHG